MRSKCFFSLSRRCRGDDVTKGFVRRGAPESSGLPSPQVVLHTTIKGVSVHKPGFPHRSWHNADLPEFLVRCLRAVTSPHGHGQAHNLSSSFQTRIGQCGRNNIRNKRIGGYDHMGTGQQPGEQQFGPDEEKRTQLLQLVPRESCKPRKRGTPVPIEGWRDPPDPAFAVTQLFLLPRRVFMKAVGRIRDDGMDTVLLLILQPVEAVGMDECRAAEIERREPLPGRGRLALYPLSGIVRTEAVDATLLANECIRGVQPQVGPYGRRRRRACDLLYTSFYFPDRQ